MAATWMHELTKRPQMQLLSRSSINTQLLHAQALRPQHLKMLLPPHGLYACRHRS